MSISRNQRWKGEAVQELGVAKKDQNASVADLGQKNLYMGWRHRERQQIVEEKNYRKFSGFLLGSEKEALGGLGNLNSLRTRGRIETVGSKQMSKYENDNAAETMQANSE